MAMEDADVLPLEVGEARSGDSGAQFGLGNACIPPS
jgi:hypothetical protein